MKSNVRILFAVLIAAMLLTVYSFAELRREHNPSAGNSPEITDIDNDNPKEEIKEVKLPIAETESFYGNPFTVCGDYFYYKGEEGIIYQAPINNPSQRKVVYELPLWTYGNGEHVMAGLKTIDGKVRLSYHQGGAVMGTDYEIINEDGTNEIFDQGYSHKIDVGYAAVRVDQWVPPSPNNLAVKLKGEQEYRMIGDPDYRYGWLSSGNSGKGSDDLVLIDNTIYVIGSDMSGNNRLTAKIYKIDINTGESSEVCEESAIKFMISNDIIYFMNDEYYLYKYEINKTGGNAEKLTDIKVGDFTVLNNRVYYVSEKYKGLELFKLGEESSVNPGGQVKSIINNDSYTCFIFDESSISDYKMMVFNKEDNIVFKTDNDIKHVSIDKGRIFYIR